MAGIPSERILTFLNPLFRYFREAGTFTSDFSGQRISLDLVGGAVRDHVINTNKHVQNALKARGRGHLIGKSIKDLDLATSASPQTVVKMVKALESPQEKSEAAESEREKKWWAQWVPYKVNYIEGLGEQHGTVTFTFNYDGSGVEDQQIEITTHRSEEYDDSGRKPTSVKFSEDDSDPDESRLSDSYRRDLSFNALYMNADGKVYDHHGGVQDLIAGTLSIPKRQGESSYAAAMRVLKEDPLRFLRLIRFSGAYGAKPTQDVLKAIKDLRGDAQIELSDGSTLKLKDLHLSELIENRVAGNRKQVELGKIVSHGGYADGLKMLNQTGVYKDIFPRAKDFNSVYPALSKLDQSGVKGIGIFAVLYEGRSADDIKHDLGSARLSTGDKKEDARRSLNFSASEIKEVQGIVKFLEDYHSRLHSMSKEGIAKHFIESIGTNHKSALSILKAMSPKDAAVLSSLVSVLDSLKGHHVKDDFSGLIYPQISGADIIQISGLKGPSVGAINDLVKEGFKRHDITSKEQAEEFVKKISDAIKNGSLDLSDRKYAVPVKYDEIRHHFRIKTSGRVALSYLSRKVT